MSADLFAEFGSSTSSNKPSAPQGSQRQKGTFSFFDDLNTAPSAANPPNTSSFSEWDPFATANQSKQTIPQDATPSNEETDDWGDFEGAAASNVTQPQPNIQNLSAWGNVSPSPQSQTTSIAKAQAPSAGPNDPFEYGNLTLIDSASSATAAPQPTLPKSTSKPSRDPNVLFDAEDLEDDDFGDFEGTASLDAFEGVPRAARLQQPAAYEAKPAEPPPDHQETRKPRVHDSVSSFATKGKSTALKSSDPAPVTQEEEAWDDFADWEASIPSTAPTSTTKVSRDAPRISSEVVPAPVHQTRIGPNELPPTNVPPPGIILSLFPSIFAEANTRLLKPVASQSLQSRNKLVSDPATVSFLQGYLALSCVAARVIAGRKLRWKRDTHLSQGMRIGPASSRATSGMKLTGIDKGEAMKEEREMLDVIRVWREQLGRLRSTVAAAVSVKPGCLGSIPELQETMPVRMLKQSEGGVPAPQPCALCGMKRDERVNKVDQAVEDSFGEWWIEQVSMHRDCRNFWQEHKETLRQR